MLLQKDQVKSFLPHREPFLFVDSIECVENENKEANSSKELVDTRVRGHFHVREDLEILKGHFPGNPILPGVVQIEMMAQVSAFASYALAQSTKDLKVETLLLGVEKSKFRRPITVGAKLKISSELKKVRGEIACYECKIEEGDKLVSEATILAKLSFKG